MSLHLPAVLFVGPMKSGTTWIYEYLFWRQDICLPRGTKETFYFDRYFDKGLDWYASHFNHFDNSKHTIVAEVAPSYFANKDVRDRIKNSINPKLLISCVRDPVSRSWSHYIHLRRYGYVNGTLKDAIMAHPEIIEASRYSSQVSNWMVQFKHAQFTCLFFDDLKANSNAFVDKLSGHLSIPFRDVPFSLKKASNEAAIAPSGLIALMARRMSRILRRNKMYSIIAAGKRIGLHRIAYGKSNPNKNIPNPTKADIDILNDLLSHEVDYVKQLQSHSGIIGP